MPEVVLMGASDIGQLESAGLVARGFDVADFNAWEPNSIALDTGGLEATFSPVQGTAISGFTLS